MGPDDALGAHVAIPSVWRARAGCAHVAAFCGTCYLLACVLDGDFTPPEGSAVDTVVLVDTILVDSVVSLGDLPPSAVPPVEDMVSEADLAYLRSRRLLVPVAGVERSEVPDNFLEARGSRQHNALDIHALRGTPVLSTDAGRVVKLHTSRGGGLTVYATDPQNRFIYYYAHLDRYRPGIEEGMRLRRGDTIGYVGSTGNAAPDAPHLHFAIARTDAEKRWWAGIPIDPRPFLMSTER